MGTCRQSCPHGPHGEEKLFWAPHHGDTCDAPSLRLASIERARMVRVVPLHRLSPEAWCQSKHWEYRSSGSWASIPVVVD